MTSPSSECPRHGARRGERSVYPRPRAARLPAAAWIPVLVLFGAGCGGRGTAAAPAPATDLAADERAAYEATIELLQAEVKSARDEAAELTIANEGAAIAGDPAAAETCRAELVGVRDELTRYKAGLQRAVDQLNSQRPQMIAVPMPGRPAPAPSDGRVVSRIGPYVQRFGHVLVAHGELWSYRSEDAPVRLTLELFENERSVREETIELTVPANSTAQYRHQFQRSGSDDKSYIVRARIDQ